MGRVMIISDILDAHQALIEEAYGHVYDTMGHLLLKRRGREYSRFKDCLLYTSPSPRDQRGSRMPSSA